jgi:hypothetical protein
MTQRKSPGKPVSFGNVLAGATAVQRSTRICFNGALLGEIDSLNAELVQAKISDANENTPDRAPAIAQRIVELTDEMRESEVEFVFKAIGRRAWRDLVAANPPKDDDKKAGRDYNGLTFPVEAMAASCVSPPGASVEGFQEIADSDLVMQSQWDKLFSACLTANAGPADVPFSAAAFAIARPSETSSGPRETTESLEASS